MRILILSQLWEPESGISQRRASKLTQCLLDAGHDITVVASPPHYPGGKLISPAPQHQPGGFERRGPHYRIYRTAFREHDFSLPSRIGDQAIFMCSAFAKAFSLCLKNRYGLLISTAPPMPNLFAQRVLADIFRLPTLVDLRDAWPDLLDYLGEGNTPTSVPAKVRAQLMAALGGVTKVAMRRCIRRAGALTVTSADFAASLRERTHSHVGLVYNTLDAAPAVIAANRQVAGELRILYAGNIGRAQGLGTAFDALRILQRRQIPVRLRLVGGGAHLPTLRRRAKEAQLPVEFVSRVRREELGEHFEWAHTALVTLRDWEPLRSTVPSKLFEDLYRGIHVTVSANGESAKIISAARAGSAVPAGDGLALADLWQDLYEHPAQLQVGGAGRTWISQHAASAQQTRNFLEAVAAATRPLKQRGKV